MDRYPVSVLAPRVILTGDALFKPYGEFDVLGKGRVMCIDYSVGGRYLERRNRGHLTCFETRLAALRWPERELRLDSGEAVFLPA